MWSGQRGGEVHCCVRRTHSLAAIRAQSHSLLGQLEDLGRGVTAAMGRRKEALELDSLWSRLVTREGFYYSAIVLVRLLVLIKLSYLLYLSLKIYVFMLKRMERL